MKGLKSIGFRVTAMQNVFEALKDRFGMGTESTYYHQEKAKRIAATAVYIAQKVLWKKPLRISLLDIYNTALIYRAVHPENEVIYNGKQPFDESIHDNKALYSLRIAREREIEISDIQEEVILGMIDSFEADIIRMAEAIVEVRYSVHDKKEFYEILTSNDEIGDKLYMLVGVDAIKCWWEYEEMFQLEIERIVMHS